MPEQIAATTLHIPEPALADLRERLARARFPDPAPGGAWTYGTDVTYMQELVEYWRSSFDWRAQEAQLNGPLFNIDLHFQHVPGRGPSPRPLLLLHDWPGSVFEFLDIIPRLTDPARFGEDPVDAFTVMAPSLPGYGLSFSPGQRRFGVEEIADCVAALMYDRLGYTKFAVQGGDWGAIIASRLGYANPDKLIRIHVDLLATRDPPDSGNPTSEELRYAEDLALWLPEETGYQSIQGTKPQTLLTDSRLGWRLGS